MGFLHGELIYNRRGSCCIAAMIISGRMSFVLKISSGSLTSISCVSGRSDVYEESKLVCVFGRKRFDFFFASILRLKFEVFSLHSMGVRSPFCHSHWLWLFLRERP